MVVTLLLAEYLDSVVIGVVLLLNAVIGFVQERKAEGAVRALMQLVVPVVGALGTFVTGSATASNILFTDFQNSTARALGMPALPLIGAQGFGAAAGNMVAPHNVIAASAVVQQTGREGEVLRGTIWVTALYLAGGAALALAATSLLG